jgi:hypothetical protein
MYTKFWSENLQERTTWKTHCVDAKITGCENMHLQTPAGVSCEYSNKFHKKQSTSRPAEQICTSQEQLCSMQMVQEMKVTTVC